ncbi:yagE family protein [Mucor ambiguus]|uniref:YagE family protein n=1 Tax=Mucor ambiguus TaxID=91626 RepID=A0A0C9MWD1_9FUNG|nr:yagE family protein [Mucor ambiguus]
MLRHLSKLHYKPSFSNKRIAISAFAILQHGRFVSSGMTANSQQSNFRQIGTEKDAGALQDLLRRVMEIDADITQTPIADFKPNTQTCTAYCLADEFELESISTKLFVEDYFVQSNYEDMLHISNAQSGGDVYLFSNGTVVFWGCDKKKQAGLLHFIRQQQPMSNTIESKQVVEYTIDEDEVTDMKGDIMILNPYIPSIDLSKIAFSYGLGRAAKLASIEQSLSSYLTEITSIPAALCHVEYSGDQLCNRMLVGKLLSIQQRMAKGSQDGFLSTSDLRWAKPELGGYVDKISTRFDVSTRIEIIHKQLGKSEYRLDLMAFHLMYLVWCSFRKGGYWCC